MHITARHMASFRPPSDEPPSLRLLIASISSLKLSTFCTQAPVSVLRTWRCTIEASALHASMAAFAISCDEYGTFGFCFLVFKAPTTAAIITNNAQLRTCGRSRKAFDISLTDVHGIPAGTSPWSGLSARLAIERVVRFQVRCKP
jgi:hypothetical protein